jgi:hypothetical protein
VARWLQEAVEPVDASSLAVDGHVNGGGERWMLRPVIDTPSGRAVEELSAAGCDTLLDVMGLKITLSATTAAAPRSSAAHVRSSVRRATSPARLTSERDSGSHPKGKRAESSSS